MIVGRSFLGEARIACSSYRLYQDMQRAPCNIGLLGFSEKQVSRAAVLVLFSTQEHLEPRPCRCWASCCYEIAYGDTVLVKLGSHFCSEEHLAISQQEFLFESGSEELHGHEDQMLDTSNRLEQSA